LSGNAGVRSIRQSDRVTRAPYRRRQSLTKPAFITISAEGGFVLIANYI
jgi:hypothetical protein